MNIHVGLGHNGAPVTIDDLLSGDEAPTDSEVLNALIERWRSRNEQIAALSDKCAKIAANKERLPASLEGEQIENALGLVATINDHLERAEAEATLPAALKQASKNADAIAKPMTANLAALDKTVRALITDWLKRDLDARNAAAIPGAEKAQTNMRLGKSGARAAISLKPEAVIKDVSAIPAKYLVPDQAAIANAIAAGEDIPGVETVAAPQLRITWPEKVSRKTNT